MPLRFGNGSTPRVRTFSCAGTRSEWPRMSMQCCAKSYKCKAARTSIKQTNTLRSSRETSVTSAMCAEGLCQLSFRAERIGVEESLDAFNDITPPHTQRGGYSL